MISVDCRFVCLARKGNAVNDTILLLNGPNLNMLGRREPACYGTHTLADVCELAEREANRLGYLLDTFQTNHEGEMIDRIHGAIDRYVAIVINAGAWTHYSYALLDALAMFRGPVIEIHMTALAERESFRHVSVIRPACADWIDGLGIESYPAGVRLAVQHLQA